MDSVRITAFLLASKRLIAGVPTARWSLPEGNWMIVFLKRVLETPVIEVAQLVEHQSNELTVTGSTPV